jgi:hypothetical protein
LVGEGLTENRGYHTLSVSEGLIITVTLQGPVASEVVLMLILKVFIPTTLTGDNTSPDRVGSMLTLAHKELGKAVTLSPLAALRLIDIAWASARTNLNASKVGSNTLLSI